MSNLFPKTCIGKRHYTINHRDCRASDLFLSGGQLECGNCGAILEI